MIHQKLIQFSKVAAIIKLLEAREIERGWDVESKGSDTAWWDEKWGNHWRLEGLGWRQGVWVDSVYHQKAYILQHRDIEARSLVAAAQNVVKGRESIVDVAGTSASSSSSTSNHHSSQMPLALSGNIETIVIGTNRAVSAVGQGRKKMRWKPAFREGVVANCFLEVGGCCNCFSEVQSSYGEVFFMYSNKFYKSTFVDSLRTKI